MSNIKVYEYFVSYQYNDSIGSGFGMIQLDLEKPIISMATIKDMSSYICERFNYSGVIILSFHLLQKVERKIHY